MTLVYSLIVFLLVVLVHEFGHFAVAKLSGIRVNEFSIGMGPVLFSKKSGETQYSLRLLPIGGYVQMEGENEETSDPRSFGNASPFKRILVLLAGATMNFILAILCFTILASMIGLPSTKVATVGDNSPAMKAGILPDDKIISIEGSNIKNWDQIPLAISESPGEIEMVVERAGRKMNLVVEPEDIEGSRIIGISPVFEKNGLNIVKNGFTTTFKIVKDVYSYLFSMIRGKANINNLSGPVGIVKIIGSSTEAGLFGLLTMIGLISANLGAINLVPFPALDGGTIFLTLIEIIIGKEIPEKYRIGISGIGLVILFSLIIYVTIFNDLASIFK